MVSGDKARELALALPESVEHDHHGRPSFRVAGKIFATRRPGSSCLAGLTVREAGAARPSSSRCAIR